VSQSIEFILPNTFSLTDVESILAKQWAADRMQRLNGKFDLYIQRDDINGRLIYVSICEYDSNFAIGEYSEYDEQELPTDFRKKLAESHFFGLTFNSVGLADKVLNTLLESFAGNSDQVWINDGYAHVVRAASFVKNFGSPDSPHMAGAKD
jgi:hypothetical protein